MVEENISRTSRRGTASAASIEAAKQLKPSIAEEFANYGVKWPER